MRSAKSTLSQERDRDEVNKVNLKRARKAACSASPCRPRNPNSELTPGSAIICRATGYQHLWILHKPLIVFKIALQKNQHYSKM